METNIYTFLRCKGAFWIGICTFIFVIGCGGTPGSLLRQTPKPAKVRPTIDPALKLTISKEDWQEMIATEGYKKLPGTSLSITSSLLVATDSKAQFIPVDEIPTNTSLRILATNQNNDWFLVLYQGVIGWIQKFYTAARTGGTALPVIQDESAECATFLDVKIDPIVTLQPSSPGTIHARGIIYRPTPSTQDQSSLLSVTLTGTGNASPPMFTMVDLHDAGALVLFTIEFKDVDKESSISIHINSQEDPVTSQISFFKNSFNPDTDAVSGTIAVTGNSKLKIRSGPGKVYNPPIGQLTKGTQIRLYGWANDNEGERWWFVHTDKNIEGWIHSSFVQEEGSTTCIPEKLDFPKAP